MISKLAAAALGATALTVLVSLPAAAQDIGSVISFGDSLSDNGNLYATLPLVGLPAQPLSPPYYQGRFSNGPVFTEYLNGAMQRAGAAAVRAALGLPFQPVDPTANQNYAFGDARTDTAAPYPPGIPAQIQGFAALDRTFASGDLVTLYGGANNIFDYFAATTIITPAGPVSTATPAGIVATATAAGEDVARSADALSTLGAPRLVVLNLPDLGNTPAYNGSVLSQQGGALATSTFNTTLSQAVFAEAAAHPGTNTYLVDVERLATGIAQDPARFGFTNATAPCVTTPSCVAASTAAQNQYLYWDTVHPTTAGHRLFADLVLDYLNAADAAAEAGSMSEVGILDRLEGANAALGRGRGAIAAGPEGTGFYATLGGSAYDRGDGDAISAYDYRSGTLRLGYDRFLGDSFLLGGSVSAMTGSVDNAPLTYDTRSFGADLYGVARIGAAHIGITGGIAHFDFDDIERNTLVATVTNDGGNTNASVADVGAEIGYSFGLGALTATPTLGLTYLHFDVDGFEEDGLAAHIVYGGYDRDALYGAANLNLAYATTAFGRPATLTGRIGYEDSLTDDSAGIVSSIAGSPNHASFAGFDALPGRGFVLGAGAEVSVTDTIAASLDYSVGFSSDIDVSHVGHVGVKVRF